jgi:hypothetical protein
MTRFRAVCASLFALILAGFAPHGQAADGAEQEARAAFVKLVDAAKKKQADQFKKLIAKADLAEMEAMEKEKAGFIAMMMDFVAEGGDSSEYKAEVKDDTVTFVRKVTEKSSSGSGTQTTTVRMIREGNQWKFGKKRT